MHIRENPDDMAILKCRQVSNWDQSSPFKIFCAKRSNQQIDRYAMYQLLYSILVGNDVSKIKIDNRTLFSHYCGRVYSNLNGKSAVETIEYTHVYYVLNHTFMMHVH